MAAYQRNERWRPRRGKPADHRSRQTTASTDVLFVLKDLEEQVATFSVDTVGYASELVRLRHVRPLASYSWVDAPTPTIVVPGSPWIWADERSPVKQVPLDAGVQYIHHDASKMGNHSPMLPLFAAIDALHDDFPYKDLDLVTDRNGLRKLHRFVDNVDKDLDLVTDRNGLRKLHRFVDNVDKDENFRIDVELVGKTCLFTRREENTTVVGQHTGYGHEYLRAATRAPPGSEKMLDHHRIITYKFGSLKILLGFTVDACTVSKNEEDELLASFSSLNIGSKVEETIKPKKPSPAGLNIRVASPQMLVPQSNLVEVKTRSVYREPNWEDIYPQIYLSQTAWLYMARHERGEFQPVEKISLTGEEMKPYAKMMEASLGKLKILLKEIVKAVHDQGEGVPLSLVRIGETLSLWKRKKGSGKPLGEEITSKFKTKTE